MTEREDLKALQAENVRLVALLESHGIAWHAPPAAAFIDDEDLVTPWKRQSSTSTKLARHAPGFDRHARHNRCDLQDERFAGEPIQADLVGTPRPDQEQAAATILGDPLCYG